MKVSLDLRLASLPGGGQEYVQKLAPTLARLYPDTQWRFYYNPSCSVQFNIINLIKEAHSDGDTNGTIKPVKVGAKCLSLRQHVTVRRGSDDSDLYHYLHFDAPLSMRKILLAVTIHDLYPLMVPGYCSAIKREYFYRLSRKNARRAARVITISQHTKRDIVEQLGVPEQRIAVIPQSHARDYRPIEDKDSLSPTARKYRLPERFIFYTGNHKAHKNLERLVDAYTRLPQKLREEYKLVLTGGISHDSDQLLRHVAVLGMETSVHFTGWVDEGDMPALYNLAAIVVQPSLYEGFGLAPLEAMACGKPVVCSNAAAIPEVVGDAGRLFDPYSVEEMSAALAAGRTTACST